MSFCQKIRIIGMALIVLCNAMACSIIPNSRSFVIGKDDVTQIRKNKDCRQMPPEPAEPINHQPGISPDRISILSWNIYKGQREGWQDDLLRLGETSDILFLQEATLNEELHAFLGEHNHYWNFNSAFSFIGVESGVLVAAGIPPLESCGMRQNEPVIGLPKTTLVNIYQMTDSDVKLLVANIHGINFSLGMGAYRKQIDDLQAVLRNHVGPIILAGDFNNWSAKRNKVITNLVNQLNLNQLAPEEENRTRVFGDAVDHVMYRQLIPVSHVAHKVSSSDHNPLTATFRYERSESPKNSLTDVQ
ncbi:endonuclease/exonuclease/phosphatase family protein [Desulfopila sp. IMCC35008]|uniref:endonuclease/exonuclease/phosphatase family protein n=1 Tax=Desulfopila sp. IMCC35008 TaxID=2653858 RepID=UPI0013D809C5|nr:endonuclease/exonuclease/phosphatase family protein [Desulfopila sp. IMCC35008]